MILQRVFVYSESTKWATQNAVGVAVPMLFVVIRWISFTGACAAILFYGVSSQAFSVDRTTGGRIFGGLVWISVVLTGGLLGFTITSLAWLARGSDVPYQGLAAIPPGENPSLSSAFWILLMVLHVVLDAVLMYTKVNTTGLYAIFTNICQILMSVVTIYGMALMPTLGQDRFWTQSYSPLIKAHLLVLLGMILGSTLVYVKSSHDSLREQLAEMCTEIARTFTSYASGINIALDLAKESRHDAYVTWKDMALHVKSADQVMRMSLGAQAECSLCSFEPALWQFCSQPGADRTKYGEAIAKFQVLTQTLSSLDTMTLPVIQNVIDKGAELLSAEGKILERATMSLALLAAVIEGMAFPLKHMPLGAVCYGDGISWRPHSLEFWNDAMKDVSETIQNSSGSLKQSTLSGLEKILDPAHSNKDDVRGFAISLLTLIEHLMDECIGIEIAIAKALEISSSDLYGLHDHVSPPVATKGDQNVLHQAEAIMTVPSRSPYTSSLVNNFSLGTGYRLWMSQWESILDILSHARKMYHRLTGKVPDTLDSHDREDPLNSLSKAHRRHLYLKLFVGYNMALVSVILIGWYCYAGSDNYAENAQSIRNWFSQWQPYYFVLAFAICAQDTVDSSAIKAILRVSLIALGGSLGYATMLNGTLAQNPYFLFFMAILVNGFFGIFSPISFDFRYSLFLVLYTWAGVATCQYTGVCCAAGSVSIFVGKVVSTTLGAVYAFVISNLVFPVFSSQIAFELEASLLSAYMSAMRECYIKGATMLKSQEEEEEEKEHLNPEYPYIGLKAKAEHHRGMVHYITTAVGKRLSIISRLYTEVETKAFDKHFMFFIRLTLIPLPESLELIFHSLTGIGAYVNISIKTLNCNFLRSRGSITSELFLAGMLEKADACLVKADAVHRRISNILIRKKIHVTDVQALEQDLEALTSAREDIQERYLEVKNDLYESSDWNYGDMRCLVWFGTLMHAIKQLESLGCDMAISHGPYQAKGGRWIFPLIHTK